MRHAILLALAIIGCRQQGTPLANPFLAPDRVPPPATRPPAPGTAVPYYGGESSPVTVPATAAPSGGVSAAPNPWHVGQNAQAIDAVNADALAAPALRSNARGHTSWAALESPDDRIAIPPDRGGERLAQARASVSDNAATENEPTEPDAFRRPSERSRAGQRSEVIRASYEVDAPEQAPDRSRDTQPPAPPLRPRSARFTFAPDYTWIQGRLEHSRASGEWKLRYIPIDGATDEYGGSVVLENPRALGDLSSGDFVRIRGELTQAEQDGMTFAPIYRIVQVQAVAD